MKVLLSSVVSLFTVMLASLFSFADTFASVNTSDTNAHVFYWIALGVIVVAFVGLIIAIIVKHNINKKDK